MASFLSRFLPPETDEQDEDKAERKRTTTDDIADFVKDEAKTYAINEVVQALSGGWLSYEGNDDEDEEPRQKQQPRDGFNDRLERALAELQANGGAGAPSANFAPPSGMAPPPAASDRAAMGQTHPIRPMGRPPIRGGGFGRKGMQGDG